MCYVATDLLHIIYRYVGHVYYRCIYVVCARLKSAISNFDLDNNNPYYYT